MDWNAAALRISSGLPDWVIDTMKTLAIVSPSSYLGGGAVRDLLLGKPVTDWDFYFPLLYASDSNAALVIKSLTTALKEWRLWPDFEGVTGSGYDDRFLVVKGEPKANLGTFADFIFSGQQIEDYDHAICQCSISCSDFAFRSTSAFDQCVDNKIHKIFTKNLVNQASSHRAVHLHTTKIQKKYPWPVFLDTGCKFNYE